MIIGTSIFFWTPLMSSFAILLIIIINPFSKSSIQLCPGIVVVWLAWWTVYLSCVQTHLPHFFLHFKQAPIQVNKSHLQNLALPQWTWWTWPIIACNLTGCSTHVYYHLLLVFYQDVFISYYIFSKNQSKL